MPGAERLDGVDLRIGVPDDAVTSVIAAFGLNRSEPSECAIHLMENLSSVPARLTAARTTVRLERTFSGREVIVEVRPARRTQLSPRWTSFYADSTHRMRIAEEWMATRRILVAALTAFPDGDGQVPASAHAPVRIEPARGLLSAKQLDFLADCTGLAILEDRLRLVGPIRERAWMLWHGGLSFRVRRWTARPPGSSSPSLDLVDLDTRTSTADAPFLFPALRSLARQHQVDTEAEANPMAVRALIWASGIRW